MAPPPKDNAPKSKEADAPAAKKKSTAYQTYMKAALQDLKTSNPSITHKERFKLAASNWKNDPSNPRAQKA